MSLYFNDYVHVYCHLAPIRTGTRIGNRAGTRLGNLVAKGLMSPISDSPVTPTKEILHRVQTPSE